MHAPCDSRRLSQRVPLGRKAEDLAVEVLEAAGMRILARNWRHPGGELDVVAGDAGVCVFVEVRSRSGRTSGDPLETVGPRKQAQVVRAARLFIAEPTTPVPGRGYRFDVVGVTFWPDGHAPTVVHVKNAFTVTHR